MATDADTKVQAWLDRAVAAQLEEWLPWAETLLDTTRTSLDEYESFLAKSDVAKIRRRIARLASAIDLSKETGRVGQLLEAIRELDQSVHELEERMLRDDDEPV